MAYTKPVIIVGAPRSGTSLMQKLLRETSGFVSVPRESDMIWLPHCHPELNHWRYEGCPDSRITDEILATIRDAFAGQALSAPTWRMFDRLGLMERPRLASSLRIAYRGLYGPWSRLRKSTGHSAEAPGHLVDKSVHAALWLNLVDKVFPDALYIHMIRAPDACIPSMMQGWKSQARFRTYRIPDAVAEPRRDTSGWWCFALPEGWQAYYHKSLLAICAFQWQCINQRIIEYLSGQSLSQRYLRVHLEDLVDRPHDVLHEIAAFVGIDSNEFAPRDGVLPKVNASPVGSSTDSAEDAEIERLTHRTYGALRA